MRKDNGNRMDPIWTELYQVACAALQPRKISEWIEVGGVAAALESASGAIYTGICVDGACTLGICAERNALFSLLTHGESAIRRMVAVNWDKTPLPPCGACRELVTQLMPEDYPSVEVMLGWEPPRIVTLGELTPDWWI